MSDDRWNENDPEHPYIDRPISGHVRAEGTPQRSGMIACGVGVTCIL